MPKKMYVIKISDNNLGQILDGLRIRSQAYHITAEYYFTDNIGGDQEIQEVRDGDEALTIAKHYDEIIEDLESQMKRQRFMEDEMNQNLDNTGDSNGNVKTRTI